jgi:hypothetical protein
MDTVLSGQHPQSLTVTPTAPDLGNIVSSQLGFPPTLAVLTAGDGFYVGRIDAPTIPA